MRPSRRPRRLWMRALRLRRYRCMACNTVVFAPDTAGSTVTGVEAR